MASEVANVRYQLQPGYVIPSLSTDQKFESMMTSAAPKDLVYNDLLLTPAATRQWMEIPADNGVAFEPRSIKFTFTVRSRSLLDWRTGYFKFGFYATASDGAPVFHENGIWNWQSRIRILSGSVVLLDQQEKNTFESMNYAFSRAENFDQSLGYKMMGIGSIADRTAWSAQSANSTFAFPINLPLLTSEQWVMANNQGLTIEIYMASPNTFIKSTNGNAAATFNYTILNPKIRVHEVRYYGSLQEDLINLSPIVYPYVNYKPFQSTIAAGAGTHQFVIPCKVQGVTRIVGFLRPTADINNPFATQPDTLTTQFHHSNLVEHQLRIDNDFFPPQPISDGGPDGPEPGFIEAMICMNKAEIARLDDRRDQNNGTHVWKNWDHFIPNIRDFVDNRCIIAVDLKNTSDNDPSYINRFDITPGNIQLLLNLRFATGFPTVATTLYLFVIHETLVRADNKGNMQMIE